MKHILTAIVAVLIMALTSIPSFAQYPSGGGHTPQQLQRYAAEHQALLLEARTNTATAYKVAVRYYTGKRINPSPANGLAYLKHAATMTNGVPNPTAIHDYGVATYWGLGVKADQEEGKKLILEACKAANITSEEQVKEVVQEATAGSQKPFDPVHRNTRFGYYERDNKKFVEPKKDQVSK